MEKVFVQVVDTVGLSQQTISKIEDKMEYLGTEVVDDTTFCVLANSKEEIIKIFDFRLNFL